MTDFKAEPDKGFDIPHGEIIGNNIHRTDSSPIYLHEAPQHIEKAVDIGSIQTFVLVLNMPKDLRHWVAHLALINDKEVLV